jgi:hypothetical protein
MVGEFPFVEVSVNGVAGKLMLDTGNEEPLILNEHRLPSAERSPLHSGYFGSGQTFQVNVQPHVDDVIVDSLRYRLVTQVETQNARELEAITPDFLGFIGYDFFSGYALKLDYPGKRAIFYRDGTGDFLAGEQVVATLHFELRKLPNHPVVHAQIGSLDVAVVFDTGQNGSLFVTDSAKQALVAEGSLRASEDGRFAVNGVRFNDGFVGSTADIDVLRAPSPAAGPIGLTEPSVLALGTAFLRSYKTVWDFSKRKLYLLRPSLPAPHP